MALWRGKEVPQEEAFFEGGGQKGGEDLLFRSSDDACLCLDQRPGAVRRSHFEMFPRKYRLPLDKKQSFERTFSAPCFLFKTSRNNIGQNRFGVIISNASVKKSTRRHLWKRRFANAVRSWPNLKRDFLVIVSPRIENMTTADLKKELDKVLKSLSHVGGEKYPGTNPSSVRR